MTNILYIDSDTSQSATLLRSLKNEGLNVSFVPSYSAGFNVIASRNFEPYTILCADQIGDLECIDFLRKTRDHKLAKKVPIIVLTDSKNSDHSLRALVAGAVDIISRSSELNYLLAKLYAQSKFFANNNTTRVTRKKLNSSERMLLLSIRTELDTISNKITSGSTSLPEFNSVIDKFSKYLSNKLA